jgi:hypothetical protein
MCVLSAFELNCVSTNLQEATVAGHDGTGLVNSCICVDID